ncbi:Gp138 family membrane-puncturing spike protein [Rhizobium sp. CB3090]|uniref:Gp138 family membrane-puncturing spike protein n=1 Tax=Rhizobium sp. CB3090 TaxID=3039156 RepID=UPI0024B1245B|nr:Gp138 family membrane-puncturing spike protein [Rhizobium sp. CB3090]WFU09104.1 Gp138 family membrane-puncturing spike protein [Rhizobium sp. CB3090]
MSGVPNYFGWMGLGDWGSSTNVMDFHIRSLLRDHRTAVPVAVRSVSGGGVGAAPTVSVQPLVDMSNGFNSTTRHGVINNIPVARTQGGTNAIICDPKAGDIGIMVVADRDISAFKANKGSQSNPGSRRMGNLADGVYIGGQIINPAVPDQYIQFTETGVRIIDKNGCSIVTDSGKVTVTGADQVAVNPGSGFLFLGGTGDDGTYAFVETVSGPSSKVKAKL